MQVARNPLLAIDALSGGINYVHYYPRFSALKKWIDYENKGGKAR